MSGFRQPEVPREQLVLWEQRLEDAIPANHPVRHLDVILKSDAFAATFREMEQAYSLVRGQPPIHPRYLAGLYLYGMFDGIRSSRRLENACHSRLDVIWLMEGQKPDHSTIAPFVSAQGKSLRKLLKNTITVLDRAGIIKLKHIAVDGSKVEADAGKKSTRSEKKIQSWKSHLEERIAAFEKEWAENESREANLFGERLPWTPRGGKDVKKELARKKRELARLDKALAEITRRQEEHVAGEPPKRIASTTDPESRTMVGKGEGSRPNYNTQAAVDDGAGAVVAADANDQPQDGGQLTPMVERVIDNCGRAPETVTADSQYNTGPELASMEALQIDCYMPDSGANSEEIEPAPEVQAALAAAREGRELTAAQWDLLPKDHNGRISKAAFVYNEADDTYRCPAGGTLRYLRLSRDKKRWGTAVRRKYGACPTCARCPQTTPCCKGSSNGRSVNRDQYEPHRDRLRARMDTEQGRAIYKRRKFTVEPRFGHIKHNLGVRRFLRRGLEKVTTEWFMVCAVTNLGIMLRHWDEISKIL